MDAPVIEDLATDHAEDRSAIAALIHDVERGFNTNDADLLVGPLAANASTVTVGGVHMTSRAEAHAASVAGLAGPLRDQVAAYEVADVVFPRSDVAVVHKHAWAVEDGRRVDVGHAMIALYVFVKQDGRWWVLARQNTLVPSAAEDPDDRQMPQLPRDP